MFTEGYIHTAQGALHYTQAGQGSRLVLCFHGYGDDAAQFQLLQKELAGICTVVSVSLPHHGCSKWDDEPLQPASLIEAVEKLCVIAHAQQLILAGYSIGGRVCLKLAELMPGKIDKIVLLAPDGLRFNWFYDLVTMNVFGKRLFRDFLQNPSRYMWLLKAARKLHIISEHRYTFGMRYINTPESRELLLRIWPCMRLLVPDDKKLKEVLNSHSIPVTLFMGKYDRVIPLKLAHVFCKGVPAAKLVILDKGHRILDEQTLPQIAAEF